MSFYYSNDPSSDSKDAVRFFLQDTEAATHLLEDEEIEFMLTRDSNPLSCAANLCDILSAKFARRPFSKMVGELQITYGEATNRYRELGQSLREQLRMTPGAPWSGGWSKTQKASEEADEDREDLIAKKGGMDHPGISEGI